MITRAYLRMKLVRKTSRRQFLAAGLGVFFLPKDKGNLGPSRVASVSPIRFRNVVESQASLMRSFCSI